MTTHRTDLQETLNIMSSYPSSLSLDTAKEWAQLCPVGSFEHNRWVGQQQKDYRANDYVYHKKEHDNYLLSLKSNNQ